MHGSTLKSIRYAPRLLVLLLLGGSLAGSLRGQNITEFPIPTAGSSIDTIAVGSDGNLWFNEGTFDNGSAAGVNKIGRITPAGAITEFPIPTANSGATFMLAGPDGNLWFSELSASKIGRITTGGVITEFPIPTPNSMPFLFPGPDGKLWFAELSANKVVRINADSSFTEISVALNFSNINRPNIGAGYFWLTDKTNQIDRVGTDGSVASFSIPTANSRPREIAPGSDGNMWFVEQDAGKIGRITTAGSITEFPIPTANSSPRGIAPGPDGNMWFVEQGANKIGRITPAGVITEFQIATFSGVNSEKAFATSPDGNLWFPESGANKIARITPSGVITEFSVPTPNPPGANLGGLTAGPDGNMWFAENGRDKIARIPQTATASGCATDSTTLCLNGGRFKVQVQYMTTATSPQLEGAYAAESAGSGQAVSLTSDTGYFWFFSSNNVEMVIKVVDGRPVNGKFWVFAAGLTNVNVVITVTDTQTGAVKTYVNPQGTAFLPIQDTSAFSMTPEEELKGAAGESATQAASVATLKELSRFLEPESAAAAEAACVVDSATLCLNSGRFQTRVTWMTSDGRSGAGQAVTLTTDTGYFWFFSSNNVEMVVKVVAGCPLNSRYWVFAGGLTNVNVVMTITDTQTGAVKTYVNPQGTAFAPIQDTSAFACP